MNLNNSIMDAQSAIWDKDILHDTLRDYEQRGYVVKEVGAGYSMYDKDGQLVLRATTSVLADSYMVTFTRRLFGTRTI